MIICHCSTCDEPDPHCEHGVNLATAICEVCVVEKRQALVEFYTDRMSVYQSLFDELALLRRTIRYLDDEGVEREYWNKIGVSQ